MDDSSTKQVPTTANPTGSTGVALPYELELRLKELVDRNKVEIPPYPGVAMRLNKTLMAEGDYTINQLVNIISADQTLAASVLRYVNSAALRARAEITSLKMAVTRLGARELLGLSLAIGLGANATRSGALGRLRRLTWRRSLLSAELCRHLAARRRLSTDEGFSCGLLHDFGKVVVLACLEKLLGDLDSSPQIGLRRCFEVVETYHVDLGKLVAARWNLPEMVAAVIAHHHTPAGCPDEFIQLNELVRAADQIVDLVESQASVDAEDLRQIDFLTSDDERAALAAVLTRLPDALQAFDLEKEADAHLNELQMEVLERPKTTLGDANIREVDFQVAGYKPDPVFYTATYVTPLGIGMRGTVPLHEQALIQIRIEADDDPFTVWANVALCVEESAGYRIEVRLLALDELTGPRWAAIHLGPDQIAGDLKKRPS